MRPVFAENTWSAIRDALSGGKKLVAILPCGATEAHGPHLPLSTDVIISEGMAERALSLLEAAGHSAVILPPLAYMPAEFARAFPGTVTVSTAAARTLLIDIARSLKEQGFACLALANSHFDPANVAMLRGAAGEIAELGLPVAFADFTRRQMAQALTEEFQSGACHAGQFETSLVMAARPDLVSEDTRRKLKDNPASLTDAFRRGATNFLEAGGSEAYFGFPREASATEGDASFDTMAAALARAVMEALSSAN